MGTVGLPGLLIIAEKTKGRQNIKGLFGLATTAYQLYSNKIAIKSVKDFVTLAKSRPGQLNYASAGEGSAIYLAMALFQNVAGIDVVHIPYKGAGPAVSDVVGG